ncbi:S8 family peptidase [Streptacidiphilus anmyonensis]|uniref:S8 family peptidase n=1 Tax=Streptacidiphilus anmyonensis TaxID=405782 RepID=UPI0005AB91C0|nr:S8 family serine peptidase [Streptacidiphilus anmyonensis]
MTTAATTASRGLTWGLRGRTPADLPVHADVGPPPAPPTPSGTSAAGVAGLVGGTGRGVRVCVVDSGVEGEHPGVGPVDGSWAVVKDEAGVRVTESAAADSCGHGTACAGIIRRIAPDCELHSVRVLGERFSGSGEMLLTGLRWAVEQGFDVVNLSLSTTKNRFAEELHALADAAYFGRTVIVASAHNAQVESFPWRFASVISVGSHQETDPDLYLYNPQPPVEFFAHGQNVEVAWIGGTSIRTSGNSFATPFVAGMCARILSSHPRMTTFQLKSVLYLSAANVRVSDLPQQPSPREGTIP